MNQIKVNYVLILIGLGMIIGLILILANQPKTKTVEEFTNLDLSQSQPNTMTDQNNNPNITSEPIGSQITDVTELKVEDLTLGTGPQVKSGDTISIHYLGTLIDGTKFDSSYDRGQPFETQIGVGMVIPGWDQGIIGLQVGGKRRLTIPYQLAYGEEGVPGAIPPKATLVFEVELVEIKN
jgi:FKBP-type peptidyl-prolyl cis-trans isomerase